MIQLQLLPGYIQQADIDHRSAGGTNTNRYFIFYRVGSGANTFFILKPYSYYITVGKGTIYINRLDTIINNAL